MEACPFDAIILCDDYENASYDRADFTIDLVAEKYQITGKKAVWWQSKFKIEE